jgi:hypothetical protein
MRAHHVEICALCGGAHARNAGSSCLDRWCTEITGRKLGRRFKRKSDFRIHFRKTRVFAAFDPGVERPQYGGCLFTGFRGTFDCNEITAHGDANAELLFDLDEILLVRTAQRGELCIIGEFERCLLACRALFGALASVLAGVLARAHGNAIAAGGRAASRNNEPFKLLEDADRMWTL